MTQAPELLFMNHPYNLLRLSALFFLFVISAQAQLTFTGPITPPTGDTAYAVAVADFNNDGKPDIAIVDNLNNRVSVILGNGDGTFQPAILTPVGNDPWTLVAGRFNGDGNIDLAVVNRGAQTVSILLGNGNGSFSTSAVIPVGENPTAIVADYFNNDSILDLAVANQSIANPSISVLLGNGAGGFANAPGSPFNTNVGTQPAYIQAGDFNSDGVRDLTFVNINGSTVVRVFLGNNTGAFTAAPSSPITIPFGFPRLAVGKFNGDANDDIVLTSQASTAVAVLLGNGGAVATFSLTTTPAALPSVSDAMTAGDINGDGLLDFVSFNRNSFTVSIFLGNGNGTFNAPITLTNTPGQFRLAGVIAPINLDACPDLVYVGNDGVPGRPTIYLQNCSRLNIPSATRASSVLVYPYYTSTLDGSSDTRISLTNIANAATTIANQAYVHLFLIDGTTCNQADFFVCLTPNATFSFKTSEYDPSNTGYVLAVAVDRQGIPIQNNVLIGNSFVNTPQFLDNYGAEGFWAYSTTPAAVAGNTATLFFNQINYDAAPGQFAVEIQSPLDAVGQQIVTASLNGNLTTSQLTGAAQVGTGQAFNEKEVFASFQNWLLGACQARATIATNSPRVPNGLGNLIATGQAGYLKFNVGGAVGLIMTPRTATWKGIRALHKTQVVATSLTIPIFFPVC